MTYRAGYIVRLFGCIVIGCALIGTLATGGDEFLLLVPLGGAISALAIFAKCKYCGMRFFGASSSIPDLTNNGVCRRCGGKPPNTPS